MILTMPFNNDKQVNFDPVTGQITANIDDGLDSGIFDRVAGHNIALYAEDHRLILQIDKQIWPFPAGVQLNLQDNKASNARRFTIAPAKQNFSIEYPAMAQDQDYLAYIVAIWQSATLRQALLEKWHS
ncbi:hypothetical protein [Arsukibacterium sp.]|uniref:hypothetical protein n=1 Tax=Arsukibacterium sp. TaxID=1977258 RepID=UPI00299F3421|nr:hypothetical protein [Arsukibacterium sp.]MDX1537751.1 hypothetical protein [Arsukibacterium sp.]